MKKFTILSMLVIAFVSFSFAQTATSQRQMKRADNKVKAINEQAITSVTTPKFSTETKSTLADYILFESFEDGANVFPPTGWETRSHDESTDLEEWHFADHFHDGTQNEPTPATERNIASIRYVTSTHQLDEWLITPEVVIPATGTIDLEFDWQSYYDWFVDPNDNGDFMVKVSTDGGTVWSAPLWQEDDQALVEASGVEFPWSSFEWVRSRIDISAYAGQNIKIAFQVIALDAASFEIDDVSIKVRNANDIELTTPQANFFYTNGGAYSKMPLSLVMAGMYGAEITNVGTEDQTNITLNVDINNGTESVYNVTATEKLNLTAGQNDTINIDAEIDEIFVPESIGMYDVTLTISSDSTDEDLTNNSATAYVEVTENVFARHFNVDYPVGPKNYGDDSADGDYFGSNFHFVADDTLKSIKVYISEYSKLNTYDGTLIGYVFDSENNVVFETKTKDVSAAEVGTWVELMFDEGSPEEQIIAGDADYSIGVEIYENSDTLYIGSDVTTPYQNLGISSSIRLKGEFFSTNIQPGIEVVLYREALGDAIGENKLDNLLNVYPNPTTGIINIENAENSTITILNLLGEVVRVINNTDTNAVINISELSEGTYIVKVENENGIGTRKMNLVK